MMEDIEQALGGKFTMTWDWHEVVRAMEAAGPGSRGAVAFFRPWPMAGEEIGSGHALNVVNDHNGVVFLDGQTGWFCRLDEELHTM